jgi:hypothetical protein
MLRSTLSLMLALTLSTGCIQLGQGGDGQGTGTGEEQTPSEDDDTFYPVPTEPNALLDYLLARRYDNFPREAAAHAPFGPHGQGAVRVYFEPALRVSLDAGELEHPMESAAIAEMYGADGATFIGWAVSVKLEESSEAGQGWYWYEVEDVNGDGVAQVNQGLGLPLCTSCHAAGADFILSP